jgi:hypothetical protein
MIILEVDIHRIAAAPAERQPIIAADVRRLALRLSFEAVEPIAGQVHVLRRSATLSRSNMRRTRAWLGTGSFEASPFVAISRSALLRNDRITPQHT